MRSVECAVCGESSSSFLEYRGVNKNSEIESALFAEKKTYRCRKCHHVFCHPKVDDKLLQKYYKTQYDSPNSNLMHIIRMYISIIKNLITTSFSYRETTQFQCINRFLDGKIGGGGGGMSVP